MCVHPHLHPHKRSHIYLLSVLMFLNVHEYCPADKKLMAQLHFLSWLHLASMFTQWRLKRIYPAQRAIEEVKFSKLPATSTRAIKITQSVLCFIYKNKRPLSVVGDDRFCKIIKTLEAHYTIPFQPHITDIALPKLYREVKAMVLDSFSSAEQIALTCNALTSRATESYVTLTAYHLTA